MCMRWGGVHRMRAARVGKGGAPLPPTPYPTVCMQRGGVSGAPYAPGLILLHLPQGLFGYQPPRKSPTHHEL